MEIRENLIEGVVVEFYGKFCRRFMMKMKKENKGKISERKQMKNIYNFCTVCCCCYYICVPSIMAYTQRESYTQNIKYSTRRKGIYSIEIYSYIYFNMKMMMK